MAFDPQRDPLGLALKTRAREHRQRFQMENPGVPTGIPGVGDNFDAVFQAAEEENGGRPVRMAGGASAPGSNQFRGTSVQPGGSSMARPSMQALRGEDEDVLSPNVRKIMALGSDDVRNSQPEFRREWANTAANDARTNARMAAEDASTSANFELGSGRAAARSRMTGDIEDERTMGDARLKSDIYFDPRVKRQREDELYQRMKELRTRYSDPAIIKGQMSIAEAQARGAAGVDRERVRGESGYAIQGERNQGNAAAADIRARGGVGSALAASGAPAERIGEYVPSTTMEQRGPVGGNNLAPAGEMTEEELAGFAQENGLPLSDARGVALQHGYRIKPIR